MAPSDHSSLCLLNFRSLGRILDQSQMRPGPAVVPDMFSEQPTELGLVEDDDVIPQLPPEGADEPFSVPVLQGDRQATMSRRS